MRQLPLIIVEFDFKILTARIWAVQMIMPLEVLRLRPLYRSVYFTILRHFFIVVLIIIIAEFGIELLYKVDEGLLGLLPILSLHIVELLYLFIIRKLTLI
jgi:hypothetical protein